MLITMFGFKRMLVGFWALWWLEAFFTDFLGALYEIGVFTEVWLPHSNYPALVNSLAQYDAPIWLPGAFFVGIITWSLVSAGAFIVAALTPVVPVQRWWSRVNSAFFISTGLWLAFFLSDQVVMMFDLEQNHMVQGGFSVVDFHGYSSATKRIDS